MPNFDIFETLVQVIREETSNPEIEIDEDTTAADIQGWDSLAHIRIVMNVEVSLGIPIVIEDTYVAANVGELVRIIRNSAKS
jgi:acyl carrier protein